MQSELMAWLLESTLASSAAILVVLLLRGVVRRVFGAGVAYALWLLVPVAWLATLLPAPAREMALVLPPVLIGAGEAATPVDTRALDPSSLILPLWIAGVVLATAAGWWRQRVFMRMLGPLTPRADGLLQARCVQGLPAVIGLRPRIVVPADFDTRYRDDERTLILTHERIHARRGDLVVQALLFAIRSVYWFNPLAWLAVERVRRDQELACDAGVVARHPDARRTYAEAMVKTSLGHIPAPLACHWTGAHPLKERIAMLKHATPSRRTLLAGACAVVLLASGAGFATWALQAPQTLAKPSGTPLESPAPGSTDRSTKLLNKGITVHFENTPLREAGRRVEAASGIRIMNPDALDATRQVSMDFKNVYASTVLRILADENGGSLKVEGDSVRFVSKKAGLPGVVKDTVPAQVVARPPARTGHETPVAAGQTPPPKYPEAAYDNKQSGKVILKILVSKDGTVKQVEVEKSEPAGAFDAATVEAAKQWTFKPAIVDGKPTESWVRVPVTFKWAPKLDPGETPSPAPPPPPES